MKTNPTITVNPDVIDRAMAKARMDFDSYQPPNNRFVEWPLWILKDIRFNLPTKQTISHRKG